MLSPGAKLGTYEVTAHIGSGGMGDVYQAHDTKLGRDVAIKVLPEQFARDPERLARFQREAKLLAALNHPNIATIHGLEQSGSTHYLVMELVPGETLRERTAGGRPVPVEETLTIARQIAEALEAAHNSEKGIIHRDLKPANVKVTPEGRVKVLDFGLAKAFAADTPSDDPSNSPTLSMNPTMHGVIMGTAAYMSPEQARGKQVTKATDIWAFGCVLYELLTGRQAFQGEDVTEILAAVVMKEPALDALPANTPAAIRTLLRRSLRKDRRQRLQDATDARIEIEEALSAPASPVAAPQARKSAIWQWAPVAGVALSIGAAIAGLAVWFLKPTPPQPVTRTVITLPPGDRLTAFNQGVVLALSPDGSQLAYVAIRASTQQLYLRAMDGLEARPLPGTEGATNPFFSPDGQWIGFYAGGKLKKVSVSGGTVVTLSDAGAVRGASWGGHGTIIFGDNNGAAIRQVSEAGGTPQQLIRLQGGEGRPYWPEWLPGRQAALFAAVPPSLADAQVMVHSLETGAPRTLVQGGSQPHYTSSGHLLYSQGGNLMAAPFDPRRLEIMGTAVPVAEGILQTAGVASGGATHYSLSATGSLVYVPGGLLTTQYKLVWVSRSGTEQPLDAPARSYVMPRLSPDGRRIAVDPQGQIWLYDLSRGTLTRLTFEGNLNHRPLWTPDGRRIAFQSTREGSANVFWQLADGSGGVERLTTGEYGGLPNAFSPDGKTLAFYESHPTTQRDIWVLQLNDRKAQPLLRTPANEVAARFSPDGRWLAYVSDETGRYEVYVQPYPGPGGKWLISTEGGEEPVWNPNGKELFYRNGDRMMAVEITTQPTFVAGNPRTLFDGSYASTALVPNYDVSHDGQRFLMLKPTEPGQLPTQINVVLNWFEELKRRVLAANQ